MSRSVKTIHILFNDFSKELYTQRCNMAQEIADWATTLIRQIEDHAREQTRFLDQEYQKQEDYLHSMRMQLHNANNSYGQRDDDEQIRQLVEQCKSVKMELVALEYAERAIPFVQFLTEEQAARKKRNEKSVQRVADNKPENKLGGNYGSASANSSDPHENSPSNTISTIPKQSK